MKEAINHSHPLEADFEGAPPGFIKEGDHRIADLVNDGVPVQGNGLLGSLVGFIKSRVEGEVAVDDISSLRAQHFEWRGTQQDREAVANRHYELEAKILQTELLNGNARAALVLAVDHFLKLPIAEHDVSRHVLHRQDRSTFVFSDEFLSIRETAMLCVPFHDEMRTDVRALEAFLHDVQNTAWGIKMSRCRIGGNYSEPRAA